MRRVLVVAAHPDDEILGCGGTILRHAAEGDRVQVAILAEGVTGRDETRDTDSRSVELASLHEAARQASRFMGVEKIALHNFPDNRMDSVPLLDVVKCIENHVREFEPDTVYTHHGGDVNIDHVVTHDAVVTACRPLPGTTVKRILFFETLSSTEWQVPTMGNAFRPNYFVDIKEYMVRKIEALHYYKSEMMEHPHSRSYEGIRILAAFRGLGAGIEFAEAFAVGRVVNPF